MCAKALYKDPSSAPPIPQAEFIELMESATSSVKFSFSYTMCKQTDEVAIRLTTGPSISEYFCWPLRVQTIFSCSKTDNLFSTC